MVAMMATVSTAGATWSARLTWSTRSAGTRGSNAATGRTRTGRAGRVPCAAGAVGEGCRENTLQLGGLIAGQLAAGDFAGDQGVDLRLQVAGRGTAAAGAGAGVARVIAL